MAITCGHYTVSSPMRVRCSCTLPGLVTHRCGID